MFPDEIPGDAQGRSVAYVLKVYPRFSETFIVTEILAREEAGESLEIFSLRPPMDPRFHPELARVQAPVSYIPRPVKLSDAWDIMGHAQRAVPGFAEAYGRMLPELVEEDPLEVLQGVELAATVHEHDIDHLHAHFASMPARTAEIAARLSGISYSCTAHAKDIFLATVDQARLGRTLANADHVVTISQYNFDYLTELYGRGINLHLVRNGLELERFPFQAPGPPQTPLRVAGVGRLVEKKGFSLLIDAVMELNRRGIPAELRLAGGGELAAELTAQAIATGALGGELKLLGPQTQQEVFELLRWADVMAAPCVVGLDGNADGLPTVLLEAMAMGVPVVASDVTGIPEVIRPETADGPQTGILIRAGQPADLLAALERIADPNFDRQSVALAAREIIVEEFDSRRQAARLRALNGGNPGATSLHVESDVESDSQLDAEPDAAAELGAALRGGRRDTVTEAS